MLHCSGDVPGSLPIRYAPISFKYLYASDFLMYIESGRTNDDRKRMAEQPPNAKMVVEDIKIELWVETCDGSVKGFVKSKGLNKMFKVLMEAENGKKVRKKLKEVGAAAKKALAEDGSSWRTLNELIDELQEVRSRNTYGIDSE
ncbi:hypothetical protein Tco_1120028 [Tanacetum coccineum]